MKIKLPPDTVVTNCDSEGEIFMEINIDEAQTLLLTLLRKLRQIDDVSIFIDNGGTIKFCKLDAD